MKNFLGKTGLSLSQAQSISNLIHQRASDITSELSGINNYSRTLKHGKDELVETPAKPLPTNVVALLDEKGQLHATQAFLMEVMKWKDSALKDKQSERFENPVEEPEHPELETFKIVTQVDEKWGWGQLSDDETSEYLEKEALASHVGQFIHKNGMLDALRKQLPNIKTLEWIELEKDKKTPMKVVIHHTQDQLMKLHAELAGKHRESEQRVNYFKAKVKNLVTSKNAEIAQENADGLQKINSKNDILREEYSQKFKSWSDAENKASQEFEKKRMLDIKEIASTRIVVPARFQPTIDKYLTKEDKAE